MHWRAIGTATLVVIIYCSLFLPPEVRQLRTGHWAIEHFLAYFVAVSILCLGWPRPFHVAVVLIALAALLEALQALNRTTHSMSWLHSAAWARLAAAPLAVSILRYGQPSKQTARRPRHPSVNRDCHPGRS